MTFAARIPNGCLWCSQAGTVCGDPPVRLGSFLCLAHDAIMGSHQDLVLAALEREPAVSVAAIVAAAPAVVLASDPEPEPSEPAERRRPGRRKGQPPLDRQEIRRLRSEGMTPRKISLRIGCSENSVYNALRELHGKEAEPPPEPEPEPVAVPQPRRRAGAVKTIDREPVLRLLADGLDALSISQRLGISRASVYHIREEGKDRGIAKAPALVPIPVEAVDPKGCSHVDDDGKRCGRTVKASGLCAGHAYDRDPQALFRPRRRQVSISRMREILAVTAKAWGTARDFGVRYGENETAVSRALNDIEDYRGTFDRIVEKLGYRRIDGVTYEQFAVEPEGVAA